MSSSNSDPSSPSASIPCDPPADPATPSADLPAITFKYVIPVHTILPDGNAAAAEVATLNIGDVVAYGAFGKNNKWKWTLGSVVQLTYASRSSAAGEGRGPSVTSEDSVMGNDYANPPRLSGSTTANDNNLPSYVTVRDFVLTKTNQKESNTRRIIVTNVHPSSRAASRSPARDESPGRGNGPEAQRKVRFTTNVSSNTFPYYGAFAVLRNKEDHFQHVLRKQTTSVRRSAERGHAHPEEDEKSTYQAEDVLWLAKEELEEFYKLAALHRARMEVSRGMNTTDLALAHSQTGSSASPTPFSNGYQNGQQQQQQTSAPPSATKGAAAAPSSEARDLTEEVEAAAAPQSEPLLFTAVALDMFYNERYNRQTIQLQEMEQRYAAVFQFNRGKDVVQSLGSTTAVAKQQRAYMAFTSQLEMLLFKHKEAVARAEIELEQMDQYLQLLNEFYNEKYDVLHLSITHENFETIEQLRFYLRQKQRSHIKATDILQNTLTDVLENPQNYYQSVSTTEPSVTLTPEERGARRSRSNSYSSNTQNRLLTIVQQMERAIDELGDDGCEYTLPSATPLPPNLRYDLRKQYNDVAPNHVSLSPTRQGQYEREEEHQRVSIISVSPPPLRGILLPSSPSPAPPAPAPAPPVQYLQEPKPASPLRPSPVGKARSLSASSRQSNNNYYYGVDDLEAISVSVSTMNAESRNSRQYTNPTSNPTARNLLPSPSQLEERSASSHPRRAESEERYRSAENTQREMVFQLLQNIAELDRDLIAVDKQVTALEESAHNSEMREAEKFFINRRVEMLRKEMQVLINDKENKIQQVEQLNLLLSSFNELLTE